MPAQRKISHRQMEILLNKMEANKYMASGRISQKNGHSSKQNSQREWENLAHRLNCQGDGATKCAREWKIYWNNLKYKARTKASHMHRHMEGTGGGPAWDKDNFSEEEWRIINILGKECVLGNETIEISFDVDDDEASPASAQIADCKERRNNLRDNSKPSGSSAPHVKPYLDSYTNPPNGIFKVEEQNTEIDQETSNERDNDHEDSHESYTPFHTPETNITDAENFLRPNPILTRSSKVSLSEAYETGLDYFHDNQDPDFAFFYSLLPDVKDMNQEQKRRFKMGVLKLASDILQENIPSSPASQSSNSFPSRTT